LRGRQVELREDRGDLPLDRPLGQEEQPGDAAVRRPERQVV